MALKVMSRYSNPVFLGNAGIGSNLLPMGNTHTFDVVEDNPQPKIELLEEEQGFDEIVLFESDASSPVVEFIEDDKVIKGVEIITDSSLDIQVEIFSNEDKSCQ